MFQWFGIFYFTIRIQTVRMQNHSKQTWTCLSATNVMNMLIQNTGNYICMGMLIAVVLCITLYTCKSRGREKTFSNISTVKISFLNHCSTSLYHFSTIYKQWYILTWWIKRDLGIYSARHVIYNFKSSRREFHRNEISSSRSVNLVTVVTM